MSTKLSEHFEEKEFQCHCCGRVHVAPALVDLLEKVRILYHRPIVISSGFRCPEHNKAVGGLPNSAHLTGEAADIVCAFSADRYHLIRILLLLQVTRIGIGSGFLHIDVSKTLPQGVIWLYKD